MVKNWFREFAKVLRENPNSPQYFQGYVAEVLRTDYFTRFFEMSPKHAETIAEGFVNACNGAKP